MKLSHVLFSLIILTAFTVGLSAEASCWLDPNSGGAAGGGTCNYSLQYVPMIDLPGVTTGSGVAGTTSFASYASALYSVAIVVAALLAVIRLVLAGAKYMMTDVVTGKGQAIEDIKGSLLGLLIIIAAFVILNTINPNLTKISIVGIIPNTNTSGIGMGSFINVNLGTGGPPVIAVNPILPPVCQSTSVTGSPSCNPTVCTGSWVQYGQNTGNYGCYGTLDPSLVSVQTSSSTYSALITQDQTRNSIGQHAAAANALSVYTTNDILWREELDYGAGGNILRYNATISANQVRCSQAGGTMIHFIAIMPGNGLGSGGNDLPSTPLITYCMN